MGLALVASGHGCKPCRDPAHVMIPEACPADASSTSMVCEPPAGHTNLRAELDHRRWVQWSRIAARHEVDPGIAPGALLEHADLSTREVVEELRRQARSDLREREQELRQACQAPDPIRRRVGGVAVLLDKGSFEMPPQGVEVAVLPSRALTHGSAGDDVCPSETAGDVRELDSFNGGTLFFIDRRHLVGAGHLLLTRICKKKTTDRLGGYVIAFGLTHDAITASGAIEVPVEQVIDGSTVTVVECHDGNEIETTGDWVVLRTDERICGAEPLPVRWDEPVAAGEVVHALGHPNHLTMKYSGSSEVARSAPTVPIFQMDLVTDNGSSGSPVLDDDGVVVGIHDGSWKTSCSWHCTTGAGRCCRRVRCKNDDCGLDGYATHIQRVRSAWEKSWETIESKECESR